MECCSYQGFRIESFKSVLFFGEGDVLVGVMSRNCLIDMEVEPVDEATDVSSY